MVEIFPRIPTKMINTFVTKCNIQFGLLVTVPSWKVTANVLAVKLPQVVNIKEKDHWYSSHANPTH